MSEDKDAGALPKFSMGLNVVYTLIALLVMLSGGIFWGSGLQFRLEAVRERQTVLEKDVETLRGSYAGITNQQVQMTGEIKGLDSKLNMILAEVRDRKR